MVSESVITEALTKTAIDEGFVEGKFTINLTSEREYLHAGAEHKFTIVGKNGTSLHLMVIQPPSNPDQVFKMPTQHCHFNNVHFYTKVYPKLHNIGKIGSTFTVPKCFASSIIKDREFLILEDLEVRNYKSPPSTGLDKYHLSMTIKFLSAFHDLIRDWKRHDLTEFRALCHQFKPFVGPRYPYKELLPGYIEFTKKILQAGWVLTRNKNSSRSRGIIERLLRGMPRSWLESVQETSEHWTTLVNCTLWAPNLLFRYHTTTGLPIDIAITDWSAARLGSPVLDLSLLVLASAQTNLYPTVNALLDEYFTTDLSISEVKWHFKAYGIYGVYGALFLNTIRAFEKTLNLMTITLADLTENNINSEDVDDIREKIVGILKASEIIGF